MKRLPIEKVLQFRHDDEFFLTKIEQTAEWLKEENPELPDNQIMYLTCDMCSYIFHNYTELEDIEIIETSCMLYCRYLDLKNRLVT